MALYEYRAKELVTGREITGTREQPDEKSLVEWLRVQGWVPMSVTEMSQSGSGRLREQIGLALTFPPQTKDHALAFRQMATMVDAGIVLGDALAIMEEQIQNKRLAHSYTEINQAVVGGASLSSAMMREEKTFSSLMTALVAAGEESGRLDISFDRLAGFLEKQASLNKKITSAFTYPSVIIFVCLAVLGILILVVIPKFMTVFASMRVVIPPVTKMIFGASVWLRNNIQYLMLGIGAFILCFMMLIRAKRFKPRWDRIKVRLPIFGDIIYKSALARSFRTFATLVESGVPMLGSLEMSGHVANNAIMTRAFEILRDNAGQGKPLSSTAKTLHLFPPMVCHMIAVGEETGRLEQMLGKVADWYEMELEEKIKQLTSILEPVLIVIVGCIVGVVAMAIFQPIIGAITSML